MHFTINANQKQLQKHCPDLNINHYAIIDVLKSMCLSHSEEIRESRITKDGRQYTWVDLQHVIEELPCLTFNSTGTLSKRVKEIVASGLFDKETKGRKMYVSPTPKLDKIDRKTSAEDSQPFRTRNDTVSLTKQNRFVHESNHNTSNPNTNNPSNKQTMDSKLSRNPADSKKKSQGKKINECIHLFQSVNPSIKKLYGHKTQRKAAEFLLDEFGFEQLQNFVEGALPELNGKQYFPTTTTPHQMMKQLGKIKAYFKKKRDKQERQGNTIRGLDKLKD